MMRPYMHGDFEQPHGFVRLLEKHGIRIREEDLESFEREGWLQPAFRLVLPEQQRRGDLYYGLDAIQEFYAAGHIELPQVGDFEPWSNFKSEPKSLKRDKKLLFYHKFQILQVKNIFHFKEVRFLYFDSYTKSDLKQVMNNVETNMLRDDWFNSSQLDIIKDIGMLMLLEERYSVYVYNSIPFPLTVGIKRFQEMWLEWRNSFSVSDLLEDIGVPIEQVRRTLNRFDAQVRFLDPLMEWYDLIRIMRPSVVEKIKGDAYTAQLYYTAARMLALFLHELDGKTGVPNMPFDNAEWKERVYSKPFDYKTHKTKQAIVRYFVQDTSTRLYLLVEGKTEEAVIKKICKKRGISLDDDVVRIVNRKGVTNMIANNIDFIIQSARIDSIAIYLIADDELNWKTELRRIQQRFGGEFKHHIWNTSFEGDNFERESIINLINSHLKKYGQSVSDDEIAKQEQPKKGLIKAIEDAYGTKYHNGLFRVIGKTKTKIVLELVESKLQESSSGGEANELEIERVLNEAFGMVSVWR